MYIYVAIHGCASMTKTRRLSEGSYSLSSGRIRGKENHFSTNVREKAEEWFRSSCLSELSISRPSFKNLLETDDMKEFLGRHPTVEFTFTFHAKEWGDLALEMDVEVKDAKGQTCARSSWDRLNGITFQAMRSPAGTGLRQVN